MYVYSALLSRRLDMDSAAFPVRRRVCVWRSSAPREAMRDSLPYCSNLANGQKRRRARKAPSAFLIYLGGNAACPPGAEGLHKAPARYMAAAECRKNTDVNGKPAPCVVQGPQRSGPAPHKDFRLIFASALLKSPTQIARGALKSYTFTQARLDHFDSLFSATSSSTPGKPIDTCGSILGQTFSNSHASVTYQPTAEKF